jgi:hypothetical protein
MNQLGDKDAYSSAALFPTKTNAGSRRGAGISEDAAKMRVARSVEKLRGFFARKALFARSHHYAVLPRNRGPPRPSDSLNPQRCRDDESL